MAFIIDIIIVAIIALSVFLAYKKGMIKTLFSLVGGLVAVVLAVSLSAPVADWLNNEYVGPTVRNTVLTAVNGSAVNESYEDALDSVDVVGQLQKMPENLRTFLETLNVDVDKIVSSAEDVKTNTVAMKEQLIDSIATPVSEALSTAIALIGLSILFFVLLFVVTRILDTVFRVLPMGKSLNKAGGMILGAARALLIVMLLGAAVYGLAMGNILFTTEELEHTLILKTINQFNPILNVLK